MFQVTEQYKILIDVIKLCYSGILQALWYHKLMQKLQHFIGQIHSLQHFTCFFIFFHCMEFHKNRHLVIFSFRMLIGINIINKLMEI